MPENGEGRAGGGNITRASGIYICGEGAMEFYCLCNGGAPWSFAKRSRLLPPLRGIDAAFAEKNIDFEETESERGRERGGERQSHLACVIRGKFMVILYAFALYASPEQDTVDRSRSRAYRYNESSFIVIADRTGFARYCSSGHKSAVAL